MYQSEELKAHLETSSTIKSQSLILAEWNLNISSNILEIGNYRHRPSISDKTEVNFGIPRTVFQKESEETTEPHRYYYGATDYDVVVNAGYNVTGAEQFMTTIEERSKQLFSLQECFSRFRPRSGINKLVYSPIKYIPLPGKNMFEKPRYYPADSTDKFKYWTSFRKEAVKLGDSPVNNGSVDRGISYGNASPYHIDDAAPFVVYENPVFTNKIVIKMQTHVSDIDDGPYVNPRGAEYDDPFYEDGSGTTQATPKVWDVEYLSSTASSVGVYEWKKAYSFTGTELPPVDGYVELRYGVVLPDTIDSQARAKFLHIDTYSSTVPIPETSILGYAYLVKSSNSDIGTYYVYNGGAFIGDSYLQNYDTFTPEYGWQPSSQTISDQTPLANQMTNPETYQVDGETFYRELQKIKGLRIIVKEMTKKDVPFDLIELSPRLSVNISDMVDSYSVTKTASDVGITGLPIGQLLASTGNISIFDYAQAFNTSNAYDEESNPDGSIISDLATHYIQFKFYQIILDVDGENYYIPQKTMFSEGFPRMGVSDRMVGITLRDSLFMFEKTSVPEMLLTDASTTYIISCLLDSVGFSNYKFYRMDNESDDVIPYFFTSPNMTLAQTLEDLARSTQTAMFFDENNDFIMMSKEYLMPPLAESGRGSVDAILNGNVGGEVLTNIGDIASATNDVFNDGAIDYSVRYIQKENRNMKNALQKDAKWVYKVNPLWTISGEDTTMSENEENSGMQGSFSLNATPLNADLDATTPRVIDDDGDVYISNNIIDFGENIFWQAANRYKGYFYSNGEIIRYDAIEYTFKSPAIDEAENTIWISSLEEYKNAFSKIRFNGRMYPTGRVRIFTELDESGGIVKHGRAQFGTTIAHHSAGLSEHWTSTANMYGMNMDSSKIFQKNPSGVRISLGASGKKFGSLGSDEKARSGSNINGIIRNNLAVFAPSEKQITAGDATSEPEIVQTSALVFDGPSFDEGESPRNFLSYVVKDLGAPYQNIGTRMRIIGRNLSKEEGGSDTYQSPYGSMPYFSAEATDGALPTIGGGGGGLAIMVNEQSNTGYFFEIAALSVDTIKDFESSDIANVMFYKVHRNADEGTTDDTPAVPVALWRGLYGINVNSGNRYGDNRNLNTEHTSVYDLAVDWEVLNAKTLRFHLHINGKTVAIVDDENVLLGTQTNKIAMFVRGSSECMFENVYAISHNTSKTSGQKMTPPGSINKIFNSGKTQISSTEFQDVYGISGIVQSTFLNGISASGVQDYNIYYDEFGTIMRECAYLDIKFQDSYPALMAKLVDTSGAGYRQYAVSGFRHHPYGAEMIVFNTSDRGISLGDGTGNLLSIVGVTFTKDNQNRLTVDDYFSQKSDRSNAVFTSNLYSINESAGIYKGIRESRINYGKKEFNFSAPYIQSRSAAENLMGWVMSKLSSPRRAVGLEVFGMPILQLGDIVSIDYDVDGVNQIASGDSRFVVYCIEDKVDSSGPSRSIFVSEVV